jgi:predicted secreted protein
MGFKGRSITLTWQGKTIAKMRTKGVSVANEPIDITGDTDDGWRDTLDEAAEKQVNISVAGVVINDDLRQASFKRDVSGAAVMTFPDGGSISGNFFLASYSENGEYNNAIAFEAELQSQGEVIYDSATG